MRFVRKLFCIFAVMCLLAALSAAGFAALAKGMPSLWDGTVDTTWYRQESPQKKYTISTASQLAGLADLVNQGVAFEDVVFLLNSDLDLAGHSWTPIGAGTQLEGTGKEAVFRGIFNGNGCTISNLTIGSANAPADAALAGLFGRVEGSITDLTLENASVFCNLTKSQEGTPSAAAALCAYLTENASVDHCSISSASVTILTPASGELYTAGGLVGISQGTVRHSSVEDAALTDKNGYGTLGGFCGTVAPNSVTELCSASGNVTGIANASASYLGGFLGKSLFDSKADAPSVKRCYFQGTVTGGTWSGGFAGGAEGILIENCYSNAAADGAVYCGAFLGTGGGSSSGGTVINSFAAGQALNGFLYTGAFTGSYDKSYEHLSHCYYLAGEASLPEKNAGASAKSASEMGSESFLSLLNNNSQEKIWTSGAQFPFCGAEPADYSALNLAVEQVPSDLSSYTDASAQRLTKAVENLRYHYPLAEQAKVDAMAQAVKSAAEGLTLRPADYMLVELAKSLIPEDLSVYTDESVRSLLQAVEAVPENQTVLNQADVDFAAMEIEDAVGALVPLYETSPEANQITTQDGSASLDTGEHHYYLLFFIALGLLAGFGFVVLCIRQRKSK